MAYHPLLKLDISSNRQKCYIINLKYICMTRCQMISCYGDSLGISRYNIKFSYRNILCQTTGTGFSNSSIIVVMFNCNIVFSFTEN